jgi:hypothetical protein
MGFCGSHGEGDLAVMRKQAKIGRMRNRIARKRMNADE